MALYRRLTFSVLRVGSIISHYIECLAVVVVYGQAWFNENVISTVLPVLKEEELSYWQPEPSVSKFIYRVTIALTLQLVGAEGGQFYNVGPSKLHCITRAELRWIALRTIEAPAIGHEAVRTFCWAGRWHKEMKYRREKKESC